MVPFQSNLNSSLSFWGVLRHYIPKSYTKVAGVVTTYLDSVLIWFPICTSYPVSWLSPLLTCELLQGSNCTVHVCATRIKMLCGLGKVLSKCTWNELMNFRNQAIITAYWNTKNTSEFKNAVTFRIHYFVLNIVSLFWIIFGLLSQKLDYIAKEYENFSKHLLHAKH